MDTRGDCQATPDTPVRTTPDGVQMRRNRIHLQPTREEAPPVTSQAWEAASDAPIPITSSNMDMGIEAKVTEPQPDILQPAIPQADQPVRRSQQAPDEHQSASL